MVHKVTVGGKNAYKPTQVSHVSLLSAEQISDTIVSKIQLVVDNTPESHVDTAKQIKTGILEALRI